MKFRFFDLVALILAVLVIAGFSLLAYSGRGEGGEVIIEASGKQWMYPLSEDRTTEASGPLGQTTVVIRGGTAFVKDSPCPDKLCVLSGAISRPGQWVACLPNRVMVRIGGRSAQGVDVTSF
jgi:hypothetical protein